MPFQFINELLIIVLIFAPVEHLFPINAKQGFFRRLWTTDLLHVVFTGLLVAGGFLAIFQLSALFIKPLIPPSVTEAVSGQPIILQFVEVLLIGDIGFYFIHRAFHRFPFLWQFHAVHHSIEEMDCLAGHRVHPVDQILTRGVPLMPMLLLGFSTPAVAAFAIVYHWQSLLIHSNINLRLNCLKWVIALPPFHHWHHANDEAAIDRNFAAQLPVIDLIFKTHYHPETMPERYGINDSVPEGYADQLLHPFRPRQVSSSDEPAVTNADSGKASSST